MKKTVRILFLAAVYTAAGKLGLSLAIVNASASAVWPPAGIALAALLIWGIEVWPGILLGAFLVNISTAGTLATSLGIAAGNTLEGALAVVLMNRFTGGRHAFDHAPDIFKFAVLAALISPLVSATIGVTVLVLAGFASWGAYGSIWLTWWLGDAGSIFVITPLLVLWSVRASFRWKLKKISETGLVVVALVLLGQTVFGGLLPIRATHYPLEFLCMPVILWTAFRLGQRESAAAAFILSIFAAWGTLRGLGPFARASANDSLLLLQAYLGVVSIMSLCVAAVVAERQRAKDHLEAQIEKRTEYLTRSLNVLQDQIAERERAEKALQASEKRYQQLLKSNIVGSMVVDWNDRILDANDAFLSMIGYTREDLNEGRLGSREITPEEYHTMDEWARTQLKESGSCPPLEKEYLKKDGTRLPVIVGVVFQEEPEQHLVCLVIDASDRRKAMDALRAAYDEMETRVAQRTVELAKANDELTQEVERRKRAEMALQSLAITDPLTGLYNRRGFSTLADQLLKQAHRARQPFLLFIGDLDGLKKINDTYGHLEGDHAINAVAAILKDTFRAADVIARIGGDEFAVAVLEDRAEAGVLSLRERLSQKLDEYNRKSRKNYPLGLSVGIAELKPLEALSLEALLAKADSQLYSQKNHRKLNITEP